MRQFVIQMRFFPAFHFRFYFCISLTFQQASCLVQKHHLLFFSTVTPSERIPSYSEKYVWGEGNGGVNYIDMYDYV